MIAKWQHPAETKALNKSNRPGNIFLKKPHNINPSILKKVIKHYFSRDIYYMKYNNCYKWLHLITPVCFTVCPIFDSMYRNRSNIRPVLYFSKKIFFEGLLFRIFSRGLIWERVLYSCKNFLPFLLLHYRIRFNAAPLLNRALGKMKSPVFEVFLE